MVRFNSVISRKIVSHEMIHWIDYNRGYNLENHQKLFCSEIRAALLSGQCQDGYLGKNEILKYLLNRSEKCAVDKALQSLRISSISYRPNKSEIDDCLRDTFPWPSLPRNDETAEKLLLEKFKLSK